MEKGAQTVQLVQTGGGFGPAGIKHFRLRGGGKDHRLKPFLKLRAKAGQHPFAGIIQQALHHDKGHHQREQGDQGFLRLRRQHPVINQDHKQRPGQTQQVDAKAHGEGDGKDPPAVAQRLPCGVWTLFHLRLLSPG